MESFLDDLIGLISVFMDLGFILFVLFTIDPDELIFTFLALPQPLNIKDNESKANIR
tara:strand:+ start:326 stop:496 length:171 start_codon:yes stop_codon:yes gene_type:complete